MKKVEYMFRCFRDYPNPGVDFKIAIDDDSDKGEERAFYKATKGYAVANLYLIRDLRKGFINE